MTHDKLPYIAIIEDLNKLIRKQMKAIDSVMELTAKDVKHESYLWLDGFDYAMALVIQAIEKELK